MQQIIVNIIAGLALLFIARMVYRSVTASRRSKQQATCSGCGTCDAAGKTVGPIAVPKQSTSK